MLIQRDLSLATTYVYVTCRREDGLSHDRASATGTTMRLSCLSARLAAVARVAQIRAASAGRSETAFPAPSAAARAAADHQRPARPQGPPPGSRATRRGSWSDFTATARSQLLGIEGRNATGCAAEAPAPIRARCVERAM